MEQDAAAAERDAGHANSETDNAAVVGSLGVTGGRWAEQMVRAAVPTAAAHGPTPREPRAADAAETLRELTELHERGVVTDAEFEISARA